MSAKYILIVAVLCISGCSHHTQQSKPKLQLSATARAQLQWIADDAQSMRDLADKVESGEITTMTEANEYSKAQALEHKADFNKVFVEEAKQRFHWDAKSEEADDLDEDAPAVFRSFADEWDILTTPLKDSPVEKHIKRKPKKIKKVVSPNDE